MCSRARVKQLMHSHNNMTTLQSGYSYYPYFADEETGGQRGQAPCQGHTVTKWQTVLELRSVAYSGKPAF